MSRKITFSALLLGASLATTAFAADPLVNGEIRKVDADAGKITIKHDPIPSLSMDAMTMVFAAKDPAMLTAVKAGDKVRFAADNINGQFIVTKIEKAK